MSRLTTDAMAVACILAGGAAGTAITLAALDRTGPTAEVVCGAEVAAPRVTVTFLEGGRSAVTAVRGTRSCVSAGTVRIELARARAEAEATRARVEATRRRLERAPEALDARGMDVGRELSAELERVRSELQAVRRQSETRRKR